MGMFLAVSFFWKFLVHPATVVANDMYPRTTHEHGDHVHVLWA
jgi:hypothetical protein